MTLSINTRIDYILIMKSEELTLPKEFLSRIIALRLKDAELTLALISKDNSNKQKF